MDSVMSKSLRCRFGSHKWRYHGPHNRRCERRGCDKEEKLNWEGKWVDKSMCDCQWDRGRWYACSKCLENHHKKSDYELP